MTFRPTGSVLLSGDEAERILREASSSVTAD
jgi:hypothetical protein